MICIQIKNNGKGSFTKGFINNVINPNLLFLILIYPFLLCGYCVNIYLALGIDIGILMVYLVFY